MGYFYGFKLHFVCNDKGEIISFFFSPGNTDDRRMKVFNVLKKKLFGKLFGDRGYISASLFEMLFNDGIHIVTGIKSNRSMRLYRINIIHCKLIIPRFAISFISFISVKQVAM